VHRTRKREIEKSQTASSHLLEEIKNQQFVKRKATQGNECNF
jgi:hypothetical protein